MSQIDTKETGLYSFRIIYASTYLTGSETYEQLLEFARERQALGDRPRVPELSVFSLKAFAIFFGTMEAARLGAELIGYQIFTSEELAAEAGKALIGTAENVLADVYGKDWRTLAS